MARISDSLAGSKNALVFLDMLAWAEGTSTSKHTCDDGYDVVVDGIDSPNTFKRCSTHPGVLLTFRPKSDDVFIDRRLGSAPLLAHA